MSASDQTLNPANLDSPYLNASELNGGLTDVGYNGGLADSVWTYSGSSTLQDVVAGSSSLALSTENGYNEDSSIYDFIDGENPTAAQALAGCAETPLSNASAQNQTPTPNSSPFSDPVSYGLHALAKLGSSLGALFGNQNRTVSPGIVPTSGPQGAVTVPVTAVSGQTTLLLVIVTMGVVALLLSAKE